MNKLIKLIVAVLLLAFLPAKSFAQPTGIASNETTISFDITNIANFDERVFFLYNLSNDERFEVVNSEQDGIFIISSSEAFEGINLAETFADFREQNAIDFLNMDKMQAAEIAAEYKGILPYEFISSMMMDYYIRSRDNSTCANADPFCTDNGMYQFPAGVNAGSGESGPYYDCLYSQPNPAWYYMRIANPGSITIHMYSTPQVDIDFCCWGPYSTITDPSPCSSLTANKVVSCSYSTAATENCIIPGTAQTGDYFILIITNYSNQTCNINFSKTAGTGTTDCNILPPMVENDGPYCVGETIHLSANGQAGATYSWTGPGGFTSTQQNPSRPNCTLNMAGEYTCTISVGNQTNSATSNVEIYPQPTADFNFTSVCQGTPTQFTSTSTTNPPGQQIQNYQWNFGDGQTGNGQNVTHTYTQPGNYSVTLTTSCGDGHCTSQKIQTVPVYANPIASASAMPNTVIYGGVATLTASAGTSGSFNFHWEPANMVVNANAQTTQTVQLQATQTYTVTITNPEGGCSSTAQVTVSMEGSNMTALASADNTVLCEGESTTLHAQPSGGTGNYTYNWTPANTLNNAHIQNPVATPPVGTTTYTCNVSDGITGQNVSVTIVVHPNRESNIYQTICANETYNFFGENLNAPGTYSQTIETQYGCDSTIHLHLENWDIYETPITRHVCKGDTYDFFGTPLSEPDTYYHTLESAHGCDSVIKLHLIQDPIYEEHRTESTCEGGPGYYYNGDYLQPSPYEYVYVFETVMGCDSTIFLTIEEAEYNSKTYNVSLCATEYTWPSNDSTYYESGRYYDTLKVEGSCDSTLILNLTLRRSTDTIVREIKCDRYHWVDDYFGVDKWFEEDHNETYEYENEYHCPSLVTLDLTINHHDNFIQPQDDSNYIPMFIEYTGVIGCDSAYWNPRGHIFTSDDTYQPDNYWYKDSAPTGHPYERIYTNQMGCDSIVTFPLKLDYTPSPYEIRPDDYNNTAPHWVITATEFQINSYDFNISEKDHPSTCKWDSINWHFVKKVNYDEWIDDTSIQWILEPDSTTVPTPRMKCKMYVLNYIPDTIWLAATIYNKCAPQGVTHPYWFVCSFYGIEEMESSLANFDIVPNPNNGQMQLNFEYLTGKVNVKVYDMKGTLIDSFETYNNIGPNTYLYDMKSKVEGVYFFVAIGKEGTVAKKVIIQR